MEDIHRLENTGDDHTSDPTFEIAFMLPLPGQDKAGHNKTITGSSSPSNPAKKDGNIGGPTSGSGSYNGSYSDSYSSARDVIFVEVDCAREDCKGKVVTEEGPGADDDGLHYACNVCALPAPVKKKHASDGEATAGVVEVAETLQEKPGLLAMLDYEHVASTDVLGSGDSLSMQATYGMEGKYFNPRVQRSEHFLEPWR